MTTPTHAALAQRFRTFARECSGSSPLYERLSLIVAESPEALGVAAHARPGQPVPNMLFGAIHALLLAGAQHPLAAFFPSIAAHPSEGDPGPALRDFCRAHEQELAQIVAARSVQTNEVRRSALLLPALAEVHRAAGAPLALVEVGTSAGLNLLWDRYGYDYSGRRCGDPRSPVQLACSPEGDVAPPVPDELPPVAWRVGVDLNPVDVRDQQAVAWLRALIWPEHAHRVALLESAVEVARRDPPRTVAGDALALLPGLLAEAPPGAALCVYDTFVVNQFSDEARAQLHQLLAAHSASRPLWRISIGWRAGENATIAVTAFAGGRAEERTLASCNPHGAWIHWA